MGDQRGVRPLTWVRLLRDDPAVTKVRHGVLHGLADRLAGSTGTGFCSVAQLVKDTGWDERTIRRHLDWAKEHGYLVQTARGHWVGSGTARASEWRLSQPDTADRLTDQHNRTPVTGREPVDNSNGDRSQPDSDPHLNRSPLTTQGVNTQETSFMSSDEVQSSAPNYDDDRDAFTIATALNGYARSLPNDHAQSR